MDHPQQDGAHHQDHQPQHNASKAGKEPVEEDRNAEEHRQAVEEHIENLQQFLNHQRLGGEQIVEQLEKGGQVAVLLFGQHQHQQQGGEHHRHHQDAQSPGRIVVGGVRAIIVIHGSIPFFRRIGGVTSGPRSGTGRLAGRTGWGSDSGTWPGPPSQCPPPAPPASRPAG